jgi:hypothetical protein
MLGVSLRPTGGNVLNRPTIWLLAGALMPAALLATAGAANAQPHGRTVIVQCDRTRPSRPDQIVLACGDANWGVAKLHWHTWGTRRAVAGGVAYANTCNPNCAMGHFVHYRVRVVVRRLVRATRGRRYMQLRMVAFRRPPAHMPRVAAFNLTRLGPMFRSAS